MSEQEARKLISGLTREEKLLLTELLLELRKNREKNMGAAATSMPEIATPRSQ